MRLERLQVFQRRCIDHEGPPSSQVSMMVGELDEIVHEVFRLRRIISDVNAATRQANDGTWDKSAPSGSAGQR